MKRLTLIALVGINVVLLALVLGNTTPRAEAQTMRGASNYLLMTGRIDTDLDVVYVIDVAERKMAAWEYNPSTKRLQAYRGVDLSRDFRRKGARP